MKIITNLKVITVTLFKEIVVAYRNPPVTLELVPEVACGPEMSYRKPPGRLGHKHLRGFSLHPMRVGHWKKSTNGGEARQCRAFFRISKFLQRSNQKLCSLYRYIFFF
jgi:hypothetical protein